MNINLIIKNTKTQKSETFRFPEVSDAMTFIFDVTQKFGNELYIFSIKDV